MTKILKDEDVLDSYHDVYRKIVALELYPEFPEDIDVWAKEVIKDPKARQSFLQSIGEEYSVQLMIDTKTGEFNIASVRI